MMKKRGILPIWVVPALFLLLVGYLSFCLIHYQVTISSKQQELSAMQTQLDVQLTDNAELAGTLEQGDTAIIERIAREQGYAKANERVFIDVGGK